MKKNFVYLLLLIILIIGLVVRLHNYSVWPREGATFDEFAWTFLGVSLWRSGTPTSWSPHAAYANRVEYYNPAGAHFTLVTPYLEHPPLFGLVAGGFARANGVGSFDDVSIQKIRPLALILGGFAIFCVFLLASAVYGDFVGLIASGVYAIIPTVAIGSRLVQNENFFIPLFLLVLYFAHRYLKYTHGKDLAVTSVLCGTLPLAKIPWIAAPLAVIVLFVFSRKWKAAYAAGAATIIGVLVYLAYGLFFDAQLFLNLWKLQLARYDMAFDSLFLILRDPMIVDRLFIDGWIYFGWAAIVVLLLKDLKKNAPVVLGFLSYLAVFVFAVPGEPLHGWYRYPFNPFLAISIALFLKEYFNRNYLATAIFFLITGLPALSMSWGRVFGFSYPVLRIYLAGVALGALPAVSPGLGKNRAFRFINWVILCIVLLLSIWATVVYNEQ
jgi:hypothetical protein